MTPPQVTPPEIERELTPPQVGAAPRLQGSGLWYSCGTIVVQGNFADFDFQNVEILFKNRALRAPKLGVSQSDH